MKQAFYTLLLIFLAQAARAQHFTAPQANPRVKAHQSAKKPVQLQRDAEREILAQGRFRDCDLENENRTYITAGDSIALFLNIDTSGLGLLAGTYECLTCEDNPIGETFIDTMENLIILADEELQGANHTFTVEFCNDNGCADISFPVTGRRAPLQVALPPVPVQSEEVLELTAPARNLPGPLACNKITDIQEDYEGQDQLAYFTTYDRPDSNFIYVASRYSGRDRILVTVCDSFAICDEYTYEFVVAHDTLKIGGPGGINAFLDDFSYAGPIPPADLWLDEDVYINDHYALDAPSIGMATFDGINSFGRPYGNTLFKDRLTSTYLDLSDLNGPIYLSFWLQPVGLGHWPEEEDRILLQFFTGQEEPWETVAEYSVQEPLLDTVSGSADFFRSVEIPGSLANLQAFQFRFLFESDGNGIYDIWNLDYVWLGNDPAVQESNITDVAINRPPSKLLTPYSSMPWRHFEGQEGAFVRTDYLTSLYNQDNLQPLNAGAGDLDIVERTTGAFIANTILLDACCRTIFSDSSMAFVQDFASLNTIVQGMSSDDFDGEERLEFESVYVLSDVTNEQSGSGYEAVARNNQVSGVTVFDDYFAYDDGSAELSFNLQERNQAAVRYTATVDDTLQAVQFHFPLGNSAANQSFDLKIWIGELVGEPEFQMRDVRPFFPSEVRDTLQAFTTYPLVGSDGLPEPILIPAGDFFIGWEQVSNCDFLDCVPVGYDRNSPDGKQAISLNINDEGWEPFPQNFPDGSLMLRPVMGGSGALPTAAEDAAQAADALRLYPNPARDWLQIEAPETVQPERWRMRLLNSLGQELYEGAWQPQLNVQPWQPGFYLIELYEPQSRQRRVGRFLLVR